MEMRGRSFERRWECDERLSRKECCEWVITLYCVWCGGFG